MTEYEIADLAASNTENLLGLFSSIQTSASLIVDNLALFYSLVFGYLIAAYAIGEKLTKIQALILTLLYLSAVTYNRISGFSIFNGMINLQNRFDEMSGVSTSWGIVTPEGLIFVTGFVIVSIVGSLYFMWSVRHPKTV
jgi:hypothetical protein